MTRNSLLLCALLAGVASLPSHLEAAPPTNGPSVILVIGAPGEPKYASNFVQEAGSWTRACQEAGAERIEIQPEDSLKTDEHDRLKKTLARQPREGSKPLWLVLIGHGTFEGKTARFNLKGPDLTAGELAGWLEPFRRPVVIIDAASASAPFLPALSETNRIVITATRSGYEQNYARFGYYFAKAIASPDSDLDKDGQTSLLEAFLFASRQVAEFYKTKGRLMTEHALIDDNGDRKGTPADWFRGLRVVKKAEDGAAPDGFRARRTFLVMSAQERAIPPKLRAKRDALELAVEQLREKKSSLSTDAYYARLEKLLLQLARLYEQIDAAAPPSS